jgi:hypothetical protein
MKFSLELAVDHFFHHGQTDTDVLRFAGGRTLRFDPAHQNGAVPGD